MPSRRLTTPTQVSAPSSSGMLTRSQAKILASREPSTNAMSSTTLASPSELTVRMLRARRTGRPPVQNERAPSKSENNTRAHGRSSTDRKQSARKRRRPVSESSTSSDGEMKNATGVKERRSYDNFGGRQSRSTRPQSPTITSSRHETNVFWTKRESLYQSTVRATRSEKKMMEGYRRSKSKRHSLRFDLVGTESRGSPLFGNRKSNVRCCLRTPVSLVEETPRTRTHRETPEDSTGGKAKLQRTPSESRSTPRHPERTGRKYKGCRRRILTDLISDSEISTSTELTVEAELSSPVIGHSQPSSFRCVLL